MKPPHQKQFQRSHTEIVTDLLCRKDGKGKVRLNITNLLKGNCLPSIGLAKESKLHDMWFREVIKKRARENTILGVWWVGFRAFCAGNQIYVHKMVHRYTAYTYPTETLIS